MVIELREFNDTKKKKNNMDKMQNFIFVIIWTLSGNVWYTLLSTWICTVMIIKCQIDLKLKEEVNVLIYGENTKTNVWGKYKNRTHS